jgi:hypothetical protein
MWHENDVGTVWLPTSRCCNSRLKVGYLWVLNVMNAVSTGIVRSPSFMYSVFACPPMQVPFSYRVTSWSLRSSQVAIRPETPLPTTAIFIVGNRRDAR